MMLLNIKNTVLAQAENRLTLAKGLIAEAATLVHLHTDVEFYQQFMKLVADIAELRLDLSRRSWKE